MKHEMNLQGLEIMGYGTLEPGKYVKPLIKKAGKVCPLKTGQRNAYCIKDQCAIWDETKERCGMIR